MSTSSLILSLGSHEYPLSETDLQIGRDPQNEVVLRDDSVSNFHSVFTSSPHGVLLKDLDTTNGTFVNGRRIKETFIELGDQIRFGNVDGLIATPQQSENKSGFCSHCGAEAFPESNFCSACGKAMVNHPQEVVQKCAVKQSFDWWPSNQLGASVMMALFVFIFSSWTYQPIGTVFMLAVVFGVSTGIRYAYHRLRSQKKEQSEDEPYVQPALWKRWPVRTALVCLSLNVVLLYLDKYNQGRVVIQHNAQLNALEQEASFQGISIEGWKNKDPYETLAYLTRRDGNNHAFGKPNWEPIGPQQKYFYLAGLRKVYKDGESSAHQGIIMMGIALLGILGYVVHDGLEDKNCKITKAQKVSALIVFLSLGITIVVFTSSKRVITPEITNLPIDAAEEDEEEEKQTRRAWTELVTLLNRHLELLEYNMALQLQGKPHMSERQLLTATEDMFRSMNSIDQTGVSAILTLYLDRLSQKGPIGYQQLSAFSDKVRMTGDNFTVEEGQSLYADLQQAAESLRSVSSGLNLVHELLTNAYGPGFEAVDKQQSGVN